MTTPLTGILGGTFNPVHIGHLRLATAAAEALHLGSVELTPCALPPHKTEENLLSFEMRLSLLRDALETGPDMRGNTAPLAVSTLEGELSHPSYTWNLLNEWRKRNPAKNPAFILGGEDFTHLDTWHKGLELPHLASFIIVPRCGAQEAAFRAAIAANWPDAVIEEPTPEHPVLTARFSPETACFFIPLPFLDISSSLLREKWLQGQSIRYLTPDPVIDTLETYREDITRCWR